MTRDSQQGRRSTVLPWLLFVASLGVLAWMGFEDDPVAADAPLEVTGAAATPAEVEHEYRGAKGTPPPPPAPTPAKRAPSTFEAPTPKPSALLAKVLAKPRDYRRLVVDARDYFDLDEPHWKGHIAFERRLAKHEEAGDRFLATPDALRWLVMQARSFAPGLDERRWQRSAMASQYEKRFGVHHLRLDDGEEGSQLLWREPGGFSDLKRSHLERDYPRRDPAPLLVSLHDGEALDDSWNDGRAWIKRRHGSEAWSAFHEASYLLVPVAAEGRYLDAHARVRPNLLFLTLRTFWERQHIDFDRIVLEGGHQAFAFAASAPYLFAGVVFRGGWSIDERHVPEVRNFATLPVYVIEDEKLASELRKAGHEQVTVGTADSRAAWILAQRRRAPKRFRWIRNHETQTTANWIQIEGMERPAPNRRAEPVCLDVEILDTKDNPNTIRLDSEHAEEVSIYLSDDLVDLDRKVRIVANGEVVHDAIVGHPTGAARPQLSRDLSGLFNRGPMIVRKTRYYGWLAPARIVSLALKGAGVGTCGPAQPVQAAVPSETPPEPVAERPDPAFETPPTVPPLPDPGDPGLAPDPVPPSTFDWRWIAAVLLALTAIVLAFRRR